MRQLFGLDADAAVGQPKDEPRNVPGHDLDVELNASAVRRELDRVVEQIHQALREPNAIGAKPDRARLVRDHELEAALLDERTARLLRRLEHLRELDLRGAELDLVACDAAQVEEIVDQAREMADLSFDHLMAPGQLAVARVSVPHHRDAVSNRRERIPELVREGGEEGVLPAIRFLELLVRLALRGDVGDVAHHAQCPAVLVANHSAAIPNPDPSTVLVPHAVFDGVGSRLALEHRGDLLPPCSIVFRMHARRPPREGRLRVLGHASEDGDQARGTLHPGRGKIPVVDAARHRLGRQAEAHLALAKSRVRRLEIRGAFGDAHLELVVELRQLHALPIEIDEDVDLRAQHFGHDRHRDVIDRAGAVASDAIDVGHEHRGNQDDRRLPTTRMLPDHRRQLEAVELRHADVDQHHRDVGLEQMLERLARRVRLDEVLAHVAQNRLIAEQLARLIIDHQDVHALIRSHHRLIDGARCARRRGADPCSRVWPGSRRRPLPGTSHGRLSWPSRSTQ